MHSIPLTYMSVFLLVLCCVCVCVVCVVAHTHTEARTASLHYFPPWILRQGPLVNLPLTHCARLAGTQDSAIFLLLAPHCQHAVPHPAFKVLVLWPHIFILARQALLPTKLSRRPHDGFVLTYHQTWRCLQRIPLLRNVLVIWIPFGSHRHFKIFFSFL